jgi:CysZ protein
MLSAFTRAAAQLGDRAFLGVLAKSLALTLVLFVAAAALAGWLLTGSDPCAIGPLTGTCPVGAGGGTVAALLAGLLGLWFLFPAIAIAVIGLFTARSSKRSKHATIRLGAGARSLSRDRWPCRSARRRGS